MAVVGPDEYLALEMRLSAIVLSHVYRPSDIPNRHGYAVCPLFYFMF
jgi:hypothetical protein